ncbi:MAG: hypothetical protein EOP10_06795 [Proteobacteria bacterium]|nr:MAG: hypothetical protein EOP10_06795 [Pseudomonadota bacterium]
MMSSPNAVKPSPAKTVQPSLTAKRSTATVLSPRIRPQALASLNHKGTIMRKGHTITGLNVLGNDGTNLGKVIDLIFDHDADLCVGFVLREKDLFGLIKPQIVPWEEIVTIGKDAIMVQSASSVITPDEVPRIRRIMARDTHLSGSKIYSEDGTDLGTFGDVYIDEVTGRVQGYEVSGGFVADTMSGKRYMSVPVDRTVGKDVVIVPNRAAQELEAQVHNEPGGIKGSLSAVGEKVSDVYSSAKDKVTETYSSIADASVEKQKEYVVGKVSGSDVFLPSPPMADGIPAVEKGPLLVASGRTITSAQVDEAIAAGVLHSLALAAGGGLAQGAYDAAKDKVNTSTGTLQEKAADAGQDAEEAAIGKPAALEVDLPNGSTLIAPGMIITRETIETAKIYGKTNEVIASAGLGAASQSAQNVAANVQEKAGNLWDTIKEKTAELSGNAKDKKEEYDAAREKSNIDNALGRPVTRVILAQDDSIILNTGDLITHKAIEAARQNDALGILLDSVYVDNPEITPEMMRVEGSGESALSGQQVPMGAPITATVSPDIQSQTEPAQGDPSQAKPTD